MKTVAVALMVLLVLAVPPQRCQCAAWAAGDLVVGMGFGYWKVFNGTTGKVEKQRWAMYVGALFKLQHLHPVTQLG